MRPRELAQGGARRCVVDQLRRNREARFKQQRDGFIDLAGRKFAGKRLDDGIRMFTLADAGGDGAVKFAAKKKPCGFPNNETDAIGRQDVEPKN